MQQGNNANQSANHPSEIDTVAIPNASGDSTANAKTDASSTGIIKLK